MSDVNFNCAPPCNELIRMQDKVDNIDKKVDEALNILKSLDKTYVRKDVLDEKLRPLQKIVYGGAGVILTAVVLEIVYLVVKQ